MIDFYRLYSDSPNIRKISIMLDELALPYTIRYVDKQSDGTLSPEFLAINPNATVPAIVDTDTGVTLFESGAILIYLAEKTGKLLPAKLAERAEVVKWLMFEVANMCPMMIELYHYMLSDTGDITPGIFQRYKDKLTRYCGILDRQLEGRDYLCSEYSIADIALYPWTAILEDMAEININDYPHLRRWVSTMERRKAVLPATDSLSR